PAAAMQWLAASAPPRTGCESIGRHRSCGLGRVKDFDGTASASTLRQPLALIAAMPAFYRAFTLIELLVAIAIVAMLLAAGAPPFYSWLAEYELANHAKHL